MYDVDRLPLAGSSGLGDLDVRLVVYGSDEEAHLIVATLSSLI
jgi:hypothetical protein